MCGLVCPSRRTRGKGILCERRVARRRGACEGACEEECEPNPKPRPTPKTSSADVDERHSIFCCCCLLLQYLIQNCAREGGRIVEDLCYEI
jgi:hypothetical protein